MTLKRQTVHLQPKIVKYAGTAGVAAIVDVGLFWVLSETSISLTIAAVASFLVASVVNYVLTARYVFQSPISLANYGWFLSAASLGFAINVGVTLYFSQIIGVWPPLAKIIGVGIAFFANFAMNALLVFRKSQSRHRPVP